MRLHFNKYVSTNSWTKDWWVKSPKKEWRALLYSRMIIEEYKDKK